MKIEKLKGKIVRVDNVVYNLALQSDYNKVKSLLHQKDFYELTGIKEKVIEKKIVNKDYVVDQIEVADHLGIKKTKRNKK